MYGTRSPKFRLSEFADAISELKVWEIYKAAQEEMEYIGRITKPGTRGAPAARNAGALDYERQLKRLCFCITSLKEPSGCSAYEIGIYKRIYALAIRRGEVSATTLPQILL